MKYMSKQLRAAVAALTQLPGRLLAFPFRALARHSNPAPPRAPEWAGPWLGDWRRVHWVSLFESVHPTAQRLIVAGRRHELLTLRYWGGSTPGAKRNFSPALVFQAGGCGPLYVAGYCHRRRQERVFRVDRVELLPEVDGTICITE